MRKKVAVQGLGFVGLAMATVLANSKNNKGESLFEVTGIDVPNRDDFYQKINKGILPFKTEDKTFEIELKRAITDYKNFHATSDISFYKEAEVVVCDVHLSIEKKSFDDYKNYELHDSPFKKAITTLGQTVSANCLVLVETTVPPGFTRNVVYPILKKEFLARGIITEPLLAHSYERVMPGKDYLSSIRSYYRTFSGISPLSREKVREFLSLFIEVEKYPLREEASPEASELAKVLENSYRAMNIAFIYEWTLLAEKLGINLFSVIQGIKNRNTHNNIMKPGFGVGGYCLTKDSLLAQWSSDNICKEPVDLQFSLLALKINDLMPLHSVDLISKQRSLKNLKLALLGVSYREDVGDTRFSPSEVFVGECLKLGANVSAHDPYIDHWDEMPLVPRINEFSELQNFETVVLGTRHKCYLEMSAIDWVKCMAPNTLVVDAFDILDDAKIVYLLRNNIQVIGVGKGHISSLLES